jgi:hypothetical protein
MTSQSVAAAAFAKSGASASAIEPHSRFPVISRRDAPSMSNIGVDV